MIQVKNNQVIRNSLPQAGYLSNGESVSRYDLLPERVLKAEGWLPSEDNIPTYDKDTQVLQFGSYTVLPDKVIINYVAVEKQQDSGIKEVEANEVRSRYGILDRFINRIKTTKRS